MERIILDKLHWDLYAPTPVDFIHIVSIKDEYESTRQACSHHVGMAMSFTIPGAPPLHPKVGPLSNCAFI